MKIVNLTPHPVIILDENGATLARFPPEGQVRLATRVVAAGSINDIPLTCTEFGEAEGLPQKADGVFLIVSQLIKSALPDRDDLLVPADVVRDDSGRIIGCQSLGR